MNDEIFNLAEKVVKNAALKKIKIAFSESCTGGLISAAIIDVAGSSAVFLGSAVVYCNGAKQRILGVSPDVLEQHGAVSSQCALQMASGTLRLYGSDVAMSVTGIAGPDGGSAVKPVGTVWFAFADQGFKSSFVRHFLGGRNDVRNAAVREALLYLLERLTVYGV